MFGSRDHPEWVTYRDNIPVIGNLDEGVALGADLCGFGGVF